MTSLDDNDRALCAATARLLKASDRISAWGLGVTVVGMVVLALTGRSLPLVSWLGFAAVVLLAWPSGIWRFGCGWMPGFSTIWRCKTYRPLPHWTMPCNAWACATRPT